MRAVTPKRSKLRMPKTIGACADLLYKLRDEKAAAKKVVDAIEADEKMVKEYIIQTLPKSNAEGVTGKVANVAVVRKEVPQVKDWDKFYAHVKRTNAWDLMQRRLSDSAVKERWEAGKKIPGVEVFTAVSVSCTKAK